MLVAKIKRADGSEHGFEINEWWRDSDGIVRLKKNDNSIEEVTLLENEVIYITDASEVGNTFAVYR